MVSLYAPLKSTSPLPSVSKMSMTRWTSGFCWSSGNDMNSSTLRDPELSRSSFLNLLPSLLISSASTGKQEESERHIKVSAHQSRDDNNNNNIIKRCSFISDDHAVWSIRSLKNCSPLERNVVTLCTSD